MTRLRDLGIELRRRERRAGWGIGGLYRCRVRDRNGRRRVDLGHVRRRRHHSSSRGLDREQPQQGRLPVLVLGWRGYRVDRRLMFLDPTPPPFPPTAAATRRQRRLPPSRRRRDRASPPSTIVGRRGTALRRLLLLRRSLHLQDLEGHVCQSIRGRWTIRWRATTLLDPRGVLPSLVRSLLLLPCRPALEGLPPHLALLHLPLLPSCRLSTATSHLTCAARHPYHHHSSSIVKQIPPPPSRRNVDPSPHPSALHLCRRSA